MKKKYLAALVCAWGILLTAGFAKMYSSSKPASVAEAPSQGAATAPAADTVKQTTVATAATTPSDSQPVKSVRKQESQESKVSAKETASAPAARRKACDCDSAETELPELCPDESCRACKATCGIPGH